MKTGGRPTRGARQRGGRLLLQVLQLLALLLQLLQLLLLAVYHVVQLDGNVRPKTERKTMIKGAGRGRGARARSVTIPQNIIPAICCVTGFCRPKPCCTLPSSHAALPSHSHSPLSKVVPPPFLALPPPPLHIPLPLNVTAAAHLLTRPPPSLASQT